MRVEGQVTMTLGTYDVLRAVDQECMNLNSKVRECVKLNKDDYIKALEKADEEAERISDDEYDRRLEEAAKSIKLEVSLELMNTLLDIIINTEEEQELVDIVGRDKLINNLYIKEWEE